jgi:hypothetical protein
LETIETSFLRPRKARAPEGAAENEGKAMFDDLTARCQQKKERDRLQSKL